MTWFKHNTTSWAIKTCHAKKASHEVSYRSNNNRVCIHCNASGPINSRVPENHWFFARRERAIVNTIVAYHKSATRTAELSPFVNWYSVSFSHKQWIYKQLYSATSLTVKYGARENLKITVSKVDVFFFESPSWLDVDFIKSWRSVLVDVNIYRYATKNKSITGRYVFAISATPKISCISLS